MTWNEVLHHLKVFMRENPEYEVKCIQEEYRGGQHTTVKMQKGNDFAAYEMNESGVFNALEKIGDSKSVLEYVLWELKDRIDNIENKQLQGNSL